MARNATGDLPGELVPQAHGGMLRRGGGRPPGSPNKVRKAFREALAAAEPEVTEKLLELARKGNIRAIELALGYAVGRPVEKHEMSGPEGGPIEYRDSLNDHERQALADAIKAELHRRSTRSGVASGAAQPAVAVSGEAEPATTDQ